MQRDPGRVGARYGRAETDAQRPQRRARRFRVFALTRKTGGEGRADIEVETLFNIVREAARAGHAAAVDKLHLRGGRQGLLAGEREDARAVFFEIEALEQGSACRGVDGFDG